LSPSRSNTCRPQSVPQKPIPSIRLVIWIQVLWAPLLFTATSH
jgi:hypothetical protein